MTKLAAIDHVKVVRFHTRVPAVAPEMVTEALVYDANPYRMQEIIAAEGLLGHQHANSGWGTFDDDNMVGATAFMETVELAIELRRADYGANGERLGFDLLKAIKGAAPSYGVFSGALLLIPLVGTRRTFLAFALAFCIKAPLFPLHGWLPAAYRESSIEVTALPIWLAALSMLPSADSIAPWNFCLATGSPSIGVFSAVTIWPRVSSTFWVWWLLDWIENWSPAAGVPPRAKVTPAAVALPPATVPPTCAQ